MKVYIAVILFLILSIPGICQGVIPDTIISASDTIATTEIKKDKNIIAKIMDYFEESNKPKENKKFDFSLIGGPYYSSDTKFGIGMVAAGIYRSNLSDTITPPSEISVYADATSSLNFTFGVRGTHIFNSDKARLIYNANFAYNTTKFWGVGYENNIDDNNEIKYRYLSSELEVGFLKRLLPNFFVGPIGKLHYLKGLDMQNTRIWRNQSTEILNIGAGITIHYDTRDFLGNPSKGVFLRLDQCFNPRFFGNKYAFSLTELSFSTYKKAWKGAIFAFCFHTRLTYGNTPWGLLSTFGGSYSMRGYYEGRFRDKCEADACLELRQHIWRRNGLVAWIGAGTVFPKFSALRFSKVLPNYGIGYRWEFKKRVNIRLDLGFGRHQTGFIFSINEAF